MAECQQHNWSHSAPGASHSFTFNEKLWNLAARANWWMQSSFISHFFRSLKLISILNNGHYSLSPGGNSDCTVLDGEYWARNQGWGKSDQIIVSVHPVWYWSDLPTMIVTFRAGDRDVEGPGDVRCLPALQVDLDQVSSMFNTYQRWSSISETKLMKQVAHRTSGQPRLGHLSYCLNGQPRI